jgi:hypothetical protein
MNANAFLLDLWNDLRAKRMLPVAVVLLAALVAVPIVLSKPSEEPPPAPPASASQAPDEAKQSALAALTVADDEPGEGSTLDVFDPSDPFKPPQAVIANSEQEGGATQPGASPEGSTGAESGAGAETGGETGGETGAGTTGGGGGTTTGGGGGGGKTVEYRYVADVTFTANGLRRKIKRLERLDILPSQDDPLLIFLGATPNGGNAVFLVDSTLTAAGEGKCKPSRSDCAFLYLGAGSEHEFTNDEGDSYTLKVDQIRRVRADAASAAGSSGADAEGAATAKRAGPAATGGERVVRRFVPPLLADLVTVSNGASELSDDGH